MSHIPAVPPVPSPSDVLHIEATCPSTLLHQPCQQLTQYKPCPYSSHEPPIVRNEIYLSGIPVSWGENEVRDLVCIYGSVESVRIIYENFKRKGIAFVTFHSQDSAADAILKLDQMKINNKVGKLE